MTPYFKIEVPVRNTEIMLYGLEDKLIKIKKIDNEGGEEASSIKTASLGRKFARSASRGFEKYKRPSLIGDAAVVDPSSNPTDSKKKQLPTAFTSEAIEEAPVGVVPAGGKGCVICTSTVERLEETTANIFKPKLSQLLFKQLLQRTITIIN